MVTIVVFRFPNCYRNYLCENWYSAFNIIFNETCKLILSKFKKKMFFLISIEKQLID